MKNMNNCNKNMLARVNDGFNKNFAPTLFDFFSRPLADFDNMFTPMATDNARVDIKDLGDRYQLKADMPGVKKGQNGATAVSIRLDKVTNMDETDIKEEANESIEESNRVVSVRMPGKW